MDSFSAQLARIASTYTTDTIFILGKGPSIDQLNPDVYANSLVIGLNDVERIVLTDISVFHGRWVEDALAESGCRAQLYVCAHRFDSQGNDIVLAPFVPMTQASSDLIMQRFMSDQFVLEEVLFLSALKIARKVAQLRGRTQTVYMVGFDFKPGLGQSLQLGKDFAPTHAEATNNLISLQEYYFLNARYFLRNSNLIVKHVGSRSFSEISASELNAIFSVQSRVDSNESRIAVVAELTTNHFGDRVRLERMIRASKAAGANYVKLQKRDVSTFYTKDELASAYVSPFGNTFGEYRYQLELSFEDIQFVDQLCKKIGIGWFASVLDQASFEMMKSFTPAFIKLPSTISEHTNYLSYVADSYTGNLVLSTGMTDTQYEKFILKKFSRCKSVYLLQCNSAYPTPLYDCNIGVVRHYHELSKRYPFVVPGYSSHDFGWMASTLAVAAGARMLEKHVKLGRTEWGHFDAVAVDLETTAFKEYVDKIREAEMIIGSETKSINQSENHKYRVQNKQ